MINRTVFYDAIRHDPFPGTLAPSRVEGIEAILNAWESRYDYDTGDIRHLANVLAQTFHETGARMAPVREGFATTDGVARKIVKDRPYGKPVNGHVYYGRGLIQITWDYNYAKLGTALGIDLVDNPDLALKMSVAVDILFLGMIDGLFTGVGLSRYFNETTDDPLGARKIVNGTDKASLIAGYHAQFLAALQAATAPTTPVEVTNYREPATSAAAPMGRSAAAYYPEDRKPAYASKTQWAGTVATVSGGATAVGSAARAIDPRGGFSAFVMDNPWVFVALGTLIVVAGSFLLWKWLDERKKQLNQT